MKRLAIGLTSCLAGVLLYAVNWLGAAINVAQVTESGTRGTVVFTPLTLAWHRPLTFGVVLFALGVALIIWAVALPRFGSTGAGPE